MATRYWVGGSGNWSDNANHWSASTGGAANASTPTLADDVVFDTASNATAYTVTIDTLAYCQNITFAAPLVGDMTFAGSAAMFVYGNFTLYATLVRTYTGAITFAATATGKTITCAGITLGSATTFNGVGGGWTFQDNFNIGGSSITFTAGALDTNSKTVTCAQFSAIGSGVRSITLGTSTINMVATWTFSGANITFSVASSTITSTTNSMTFTGGGATYGTVNFNAAGTYTIADANTFTNLTRNGTAVKTDGLTFSANQTITGTFTVTGNSLTNRILVQSNTVGTARIITAAIATLSNCDFQDITAAGGAIPFTGTSLGDALGNTNITTTTPVTRYAVVAGNWSSTATWSTSNGGAGGASVPLPQDTVNFTAASAAGTYTADMPRLCATLDCNTVSAFTRTLDFSSVANTVYGAVVLSSGAMTLSGTQGLTLAARSSVGITSNSIAFTQAITIVAFGGTYTLQDNFNISALTLTLTNGTLDTNGKTVTCGTFSSSNSNTRALTLGASTINVSVAWTLTTSTGITFTANTSTIAITGTSASPFSGGGLTYATVTCTSTLTTTFAITGANTFGTLTITGAASKVQAITFSANQTITGTLTINGNATTNRLLISSATRGTAVTFSAGTIVTANVDYMDITAGGGANWNLTLQGTDSSGDCGGNTGITFTTAANQHWIKAAGAGGNWSGGATNWTSRTPLPQDDVFFDFAFGTSQTVTADMPRLGKAISWTSATFTTALTLTHSIATESYGSITLVSGLTITSNTSLHTLAPRTSVNLTSNTVTFGNPITINGTGTVTLADGFTIGATRTFTVTLGTFNANNQALSVGLFASSNSNTRAITMGSGVWTLSGVGTVWSMATTTGLTLIPNTSQIKLTDTSSSAKNINGSSSGEISFYDLYITGAGTGTYLILGNNVWHDFKVDTPPHTIIFTAGTTNVVTTFTVNGTVGNLVTLQSSTAGSKWFLSCPSGTIAPDYLSITDGYAGGGATYSPTNLTNGGGNNGWVTATSRYWVTGGNGYWNSTTNWSATSGGASGATVPTADSGFDVFFDGNSGSGTAVINAATVINNLTCTGFTGTIIGTSALNITGNSILVSGMTWLYGATTTFQTVDSKTITSGSQAYKSIVILNCVGGTWTLQDAFSCTLQTLSQTSGTFIANNQNVTFGAFSSNNLVLRAITMGSGVWTGNGVNLPWSATGSNLTLNANTSTIVINDTSTTAKTFAGGGFTYSTVTFTGDNITITGSNTFSTLNVNNAGLATGLLITSATTQTVTTAFSTNGSAGNLAIIKATTAGSAATLSKTSGTISEDYMSLRDSAAIGGASWYAGTHSTNVSGNSGWIFTGPPGGGGMFAFF